MELETQVVVIGGGATGTAVLRDLTMRGLQAVLFERGNLSEGTTGNFHGLLHSGGRYAVKDKPAAVECIEENRILRRIAPQAIEDTGGFFVVLDDSDEEFLPTFLEGCAEVDIPTEVLSGAEALREEPELSPKTRYAVTVPDGSIDGWDLCTGSVASAKEYGARVFLYTPVTAILREGDRVVGVKAVDQTCGDEYIVHADYVINATGPWTDKVTDLADIRVPMVLSKGTMVVLDSRPVKRAINRCRYPSDGDIIVPVGTTIVLGTTSVTVEDPDSFAIEEWEVDKMLDECIQMVPMIEDMRLQRSYAAVRPLYEPPVDEEAEEGREVSRAFYVLDHEKLDGVGGLITITGGKLTTSRLMAGKTVDLVCAKMGIDAPCRTHLEPLPTGD
ncbi:MAG: FAD-dependent oxidoreductase [Anaerolineales bacterium]|nr:MAG: FAD-dependent oxidoreductase [Anaerolineales bacterium]